MTDEKTDTQAIREHIAMELIEAIERSDKEAILSTLSALISDTLDSMHESHD